MKMVTASSVNVTSPINVTSIWPLYGPIAGGTKLTISGQLLTNVSGVIIGQYKADYRCGCIHSIVKCR